MAKDQCGLIFKRNYQVKVLCFPSSHTKQSVIRSGTEPWAQGTTQWHTELTCFFQKPVTEPFPAALLEVENHPGIKLQVILFPLCLYPSYLITFQEEAAAQPPVPLPGPVA